MYTEWRLTSTEPIVLCTLYPKYLTWLSLSPVQTRTQFSCKMFSCKILTLLWQDFSKQWIDFGSYLTGCYGYFPMGDLTSAAPEYLLPRVTTRPSTTVSPWQPCQSSRSHKRHACTVCAMSRDALPNSVHSRRRVLFSVCTGVWT